MPPSSTNAPGSNGPSNPNDPTPGVGRRIGEHARDVAEDVATDHVGKLIAKAFRWLGRRLGIKDRAKPVADRTTRPFDEP